METTRGRMSGLVALALSAVVLLGACGGGAESAESAGASAAVDGRVTLLDAQELTILDQRIRYPKKQPAQVSSSIVLLEPGQETGWHKHGAPMFAYILEGTMTVEYDAGVTKEYPAGTALMEATGVFHNGTNKGDAPVRVLVVSMGAEGVKNTVERLP